MNIFFMDQILPVFYFAGYKARPKDNLSHEVKQIILSNWSDCP